MNRVKVSNQYRIVIPRRVREALHIRKGQIVSVLAVGGVIEIVPDEDIREMEGLFPELMLTDIREESA